MDRSDRIALFCSELWEWFHENRRSLPWRGLTEENADRKAYFILVSEVMLQQTQVSRVISLYKNFIQYFPHIEGLANASNSEILIAWRGLGYNSRALRLRDAARTIVERGGIFPRGMDELQELPGIGHYTAGAIRNFAFDIPTPCIDTNIRRILHRFFVGPENPDGTWRRSDRALLSIAEKVLQIALGGSSSRLHGRPSPRLVRRRGLATPLPPGERPGARTSADFHAALMDFGSIICTKKNPRWDLMSPALRSVCKSYGKKIAVTKKAALSEPGRMMAGRFVPNRICRGRIVEVLRDAKQPLTLEEVGASSIADWTMGDHRAWLAELLKKLACDRIIQERRGEFWLG